MNQSPLIRLENIHFSYPNGTQALNGVNLSILTGEKMVLMGANGAGKTSLFLTLNGLYQPSQGQYFINDQPVVWDKAHRDQLRQSVGIVFQEPDHQLFAPTVYEEISFGLINLGFNRERAAKRIDDVMNLMKMTHLKDKAPHLLSYGQKKQVAMASIIAMDPQVIVLDEPLSGLDPEHVQQTIGLMNLLHSHGKTLIVSTHDVNFAWQWANRVAVMHNGRVMQTGYPHEIFANQTLIREGSLEMPMLVSVWQALMQNNDLQRCPRTIDELSLVMKNERAAY